MPEATSSGGYKLRPHAFTDYPFKVSAQSPAGDLERVSLAPSVEDATLWLGEFTPDASGTWTLRLENLQAADPACYEDVVVRVDAGKQGANALIILIASVLVLTSLVSTALLKRRRPLEAANTIGPG